MRLLFFVRNLQAPPKVLMDNGTFESTGCVTTPSVARQLFHSPVSSCTELLLPLDIQIPHRLLEAVERISTLAQVCWKEAWSEATRSQTFTAHRTAAAVSPLSRVDSLFGYDDCSTQLMKCCTAPPQQAWPTPAPTDREVNLHKEPLYNSSIAETSFIAKERTPAAEPNAPSTARGSDASVATKPIASTATTASNEAQEAEELLTDQLLEIAAARRRAEVYSEASRLKQEQEAAAAKEKDNERARELTNARLRREAEQKARDAEMAQKEALARQKREAEEKARNAERAQKQAQQRKAEAAEAAEKARLKKQRDAEREHQRKLNSKKEGEERERRAAEARAAAQEKRDEEEKEKRKRILAQMAM